MHTTDNKYKSIYYMYSMYIIFYHYSIDNISTLDNNIGMHIHTHTPIKLLTIVPKGVGQHSLQVLIISQFIQHFRERSVVVLQRRYESMQERARD